MTDNLRNCPGFHDVSQSHWPTPSRYPSPNSSTAWQKPYPAEPKTADGEDGSLRIEPLRELKAQRFNLVTHENIEVKPKPRTAGGEATARIAELEGDPTMIRKVEIRKMKPPPTKDISRRGRVAFGSRTANNSSF